MYLPDYLHSHRLTVLVLVAVITGFIAFSIVRCNQVTKHHLEESQSTSRENDEASKGQEKLTSKQNELISRYKMDEKEFSLSLASYIWVSQDGAVSLKFSQDGNYTVIRNGVEEKTGTYALSALSGASISGDTTQASDDAAPTTASILFENDATKLISIQRIPRSEEDGIDLVMTTDAFGTKMSFTAKRLQENIAVEGISDEIKNQLGADETDIILKAVDEQVRKNYPSTTSITFKPVIIWNYETNVVQLTFDLNDVRSSRLTLMWNRNDNTISFTDGRTPQQ